MQQGRGCVRAWKVRRSGFDSVGSEGLPVVGGPLEEVHLSGRWTFGAPHTPGGETRSPRPALLLKRWPSAWGMGIVEGAYLFSVRHALARPVAPALAQMPGLVAT